MPRLYFQLRNDLDVDDEAGSGFPDLGAARQRAIEYAVNMSAASILEHRKLNLRQQIEVANQSGEIACVVEFGDG